MVLPIMFDAMTMLPGSSPLTVRPEDAADGGGFIFVVCAWSFAAGAGGFVVCTCVWPVVLGITVGVDGSVLGCAPVWSVPGCGGGWVVVCASVMPPTVSA